MLADFHCDGTKLNLINRLKSRAIMLESSSLADLSNVGDNPSGPGDPDFCFLMACSTIDSQKMSGLGVDELVLMKLEMSGCFWPFQTLLNASFCLLASSWSATSSRFGLRALFISSQALKLPLTNFW